MRQVTRGPLTQTPICTLRSNTPVQHTARVGESRLRLLPAVLAVLELKHTCEAHSECWGIKVETAGTQTPVKYTARAHACWRVNVEAEAVRVLEKQR